MGGQERSYFASEHNLSTEASSLWTDVYDIVGGAHDFFVVFHHYNGVAQVPQLLEHVYKSARIAGM